MANAIPHPQIADAFCLGIVNDVAANVDADFLVPSLTKFGAGPTLSKWRLRRKINASYPLFVPKRGSIASLEGGMQMLVQTLAKKLNEMNNVTVRLNVELHLPSFGRRQATLRKKKQRCFPFLQ